MKKQDWKKESFRDLATLGSWVFYLIVLARATIRPFRPFLDELLIAGALILLLEIFYKKPDYRISRAFVLAVFTSLFYHSTFFTIFAFLVLLAIIYTRAESGKQTGVLVGVIVAIIAYFLPRTYLV